MPSKNKTSQGKIDMFMFDKRKNAKSAVVAVECRSEQNPDEESAAEKLSEVQSNAVHLGLIEEESSAGVMEGIDREGAEDQSH